MRGKSKSSKRGQEIERSKSKKTQKPRLISPGLIDFRELSGREADIKAFLRAALDADLSSPKGKAALRLARGLRRQARVLGGPQAKELEAGRARIISAQCLQSSYHAWPKCFASELH